MKVYQWSNKEVFSDATPVKLIDGVLYQIEGKYISESSEIDDSLIGGNKSAEGGEDTNQEVVVTEPNVVIACKLDDDRVGTYDKKQVKNRTKAIYDAMKKDSSIDQEKLKKHFQELVARVCKDMASFRFYEAIEDFDSEGPLVIMENLSENNTEAPGTPVRFYVFNHDLQVEKY